VWIDFTYLLVKCKVASILEFAVTLFYVLAITNSK